jgi:hypothetical protein
MDTNKESDLIAAGHCLDWKSIASTFSIMAARDVLSMKKMERHQDIKEKVRWLTTEEQPLALLFFSHRWETLEHPDPQGRHLRALQEFLRRICLCVEAMFVPRQERLQLVHSLSFEGTLQAEELTRRMFGYGPFSGGAAGMKGSDAKQVIYDLWKVHQDNRPAFREWLLNKIGLWLDFSCMPQKPLAPEDESVFRSTLSMLDSLVMSCTLVALRDAGDDYSVRGWCASEFFLASAHSFAKNLFIDVKRLENAEEVAIAPAPTPSKEAITDATKIMNQSYEQDIAAFREACAQWISFECPLIEISPPGPWAAYRDLQGSSFYAAEIDPNPSRLVLEAIRSVESALIEKWLISEKQRLFDLGKELALFLQCSGLHCALPSDTIYLSFLLACHGWIDAFRPLFKECLRRYLETTMDKSNGNADDSVPALLVILKPLAQNFRALFSELKPSSAGSWDLRLSTGSGTDPRERSVIEQVRTALTRKPPEFTFIDSNDPRMSQYAVEHLALGIDLKMRPTITADKCID